MVRIGMEEKEPTKFATEVESAAKEEEGRSTMEYG